ncbi:SLAC1 anion channel family protein [Pinisolibacter sp.]|uniref:SLAC1 anion channel family protein n=1 Tax=Pinisolibacter sp. TaxID=2172024 RepID=UPI002FDC81F7
MSNTTPAAAGGPTHAGPGGLAHLPLPLFAAPMGIGGLGLAWREAGHALGAPKIVGEGLLGLAAAVWLLILALHVVRAMRHPEALAGDLKHPIRSAFVGAITIGLMIVAGGLIPYARGLASGVWIVAVVVHLAIGIWTVRGLLTAPREAATLTPPLLIPMVGNILAPVIGAKLGYHDLSWGLFGLGALLWVLIQPSIINRIATGPTMPDKLKPTLVILLAPPAVGSIALANLSGGFGPGPSAIYGLAAFVAAVLLTITPIFRRIPFAMSWWGYTFPSAAFSVATSAFTLAHPSAAMIVASWTVLALASAIITLVAIATLKAAAGGHLLVPEG